MGGGQICPPRYMAIRGHFEYHFLTGALDVKGQNPKAQPSTIKITRRTTGARGCYFQTSVYQVI